ncbi:MAG: FAD-binding oxidoreductase [Chitinophagaceae bacterium]
MTLFLLGNHATPPGLGLPDYTISVIFQGSKLVVIFTEMKIDYLVIGQGISGSFLCHELGKAGLSFIVIDEFRPQSASRIASGIINPVTGRRIVKTWMIDELLPFAWNAYKTLEDLLGVECIRETTSIDFFPTPQMRLAFLDRLQEEPQYISLPADENSWYHLLNYNFGYGIIHPCHLVNLQELLPAWRKSFLAKGLLRETRFEPDQVVLTSTGIEYQNIFAGKIIFCDGISSQENNWFKNLPFAANKGEVLIVEIKELPPGTILKRGISIVPWKEDLFWVGSSHEWQFENDQPTDLFRQKTEAQLKSFLKLPFKIIDHWASIRPATLERRPFIGFHPLHPQIGIFNGMGTKGCSLAPYFARQLVQHLTNKTALLPDVNIERFKRVLSLNR